MWKKFGCSQEFAVLLLTQLFYILTTYSDQFLGRAMQRLPRYEQLKRGSFPPYKYKLFPWHSKSGKIKKENMAKIDEIYLFSKKNVFSLAFIEHDNLLSIVK